MDFKGPLFDAGPKRYLFTVLDDHSRYLLAVGLCADQMMQTAWATLWDVFGEAGLPESILSDNGFGPRGPSVGLDGRHYSHLLDPRSGMPAHAVCGATVVAPKSVTANALATILCVLGPEEGFKLVERIPGAECLLITSAGKQLRSRGFAALELVALADEKKDDKKENGWPAGHQVTVSLEIPKATRARRYRRPYVAVWVENSEGKAVRTVTVWGNSQRWLPTMSGWWKIGRSDRRLVKTVTRATRSPGKYTVVWDGKDDSGKALPQGTYTIRVEVHREHGKHVYQTGKIACLDQAAKITLAKNAETGETVVEYARRK